MKRLGDHLIDVGVLPEPNEIELPLVREIYSQQGLCCWMGGQGTVPWEQNTQQSPDLGRSNA